MGFYFCCGMTLKVAVLWPHEAHQAMNLHRTRQTRLFSYKLFTELSHVSAVIMIPMSYQICSRQYSIIQNNFSYAGDTVHEDNLAQIDSCLPVIMLTDFISMNCTLDATVSSIRTRHQRRRQWSYVWYLNKRRPRDYCKSYPAASANMLMYMHGCTAV